MVLSAGRHKSVRMRQKIESKDSLLECINASIPPVEKEERKLFKYRETDKYHEFEKKKKKRFCY